MWAVAAQYYNLHLRLSRLAKGEIKVQVQGDLTSGFVLPRLVHVSSFQDDL